MHLMLHNHWWLGPLLITILSCMLAKVIVSWQSETYGLSGFFYVPIVVFISTVAWLVASIMK